MTGLLLALGCAGPATPERPPQDSPAADSPAPAELARVAFPGGPSFMGSPPGEGERDERPRHRVEVAPFALGLHEVTVAEYRACVDDGVCAPWASDDPDRRQGCPWDDGGDEDRPMACLTWGMAAGFCAWAGGRLPSEAEWEHAARGGRDHTFPWGEAEPTCLRTSMGRAAGCAHNRTHPACATPGDVTPQGLCDLGGNVLEWVQDTYQPDYRGAPADGSAWEVPDAEFRVMRGAGVGSGVSPRSADRTFHEPAFAYPGLGVRCAW